MFQHFERSLNEEDYIFEAAKEKDPDDEYEEYLMERFNG